MKLWDMTHWVKVTILNFGLNPFPTITLISPNLQRNLYFTRGLTSWGGTYC